MSGQDILGIVVNFLYQESLFVPLSVKEWHSSVVEHVTADLEVTGSNSPLVL